MVTQVAITGPNSFVGSHLVESLMSHDDVEITLLEHNARKSWMKDNKNVVTMQGDLLNAESLRGFVRPDSNVVHLAYLRAESKETNLNATANLIDACKRAKIRRLIHCSTAVVAGRISENGVTEDSVCNPVSEYERTKLSIENLITEMAGGMFEVVILRPTVVFGQGGQNLDKIGSDLIHGNRLLNYLKTCVYNYRKRMNLVSVRCVSAAIMFFLDSKEQYDGDIFIVSDDESPNNNYRYVEKAFLNALGSADYSIPIVAMPSFITRLLMRAAGKSNINPECLYDCQKIINAGFIKTGPFEEELADFLSWYKEAGK